MSKKVLLAATALFIIAGVAQEVHAQTVADLRKEMKALKEQKKSQSGLGKDQKDHTYLGHKYHGQVQGKKPQGKGIMLFNCKSWKYDGDFFTVKGDFDGNIIANPEFINSQLEFIYENGIAYYDESNNIILKPGGRIRHYFDLQPKDNGKRMFYESIGQELTKDSVINVESMYTTELRLVDEIETGLPKELNPPHFFASCIIKLKESQPRTEMSRDEFRGRPAFQTFKKDGSLNYIKNFAGNISIASLKRNLDIHGYKDEQGRIWDVYYENEGDHRIKYKVVYPDSSTYGEEIIPRIRTDVRTFKIVYPNGDILSESTMILNNGYKLNTPNSSYRNMNDFVRLNTSKTYPEMVINTITDSKGLLSGLSTNEEIVKALEETIFQRFPHKTDKVIIYASNNSGTYYKEGKYISNEEVRLAEEKQKAAAEEEKERKMASLKKRFGFDPMKKTVIELVTVGKSLSLLNDFLEFCSDYNISPYNKCYLKPGFAGWTRGGEDRYNRLMVRSGLYAFGVLLIEYSGDKITKVRKRTDEEMARDHGLRKDILGRYYDPYFSISGW